MVRRTFEQVYNSPFIGSVFTGFIKIHLCQIILRVGALFFGGGKNQQQSFFFLFIFKVNLSFKEFKTGIVKFAFELPDQLKGFLGVSG